MSFHTRSLALPALVLAALPFTLQQERSFPAHKVTLHPIKDNTLFQNSLGSLSNGAGDHVFAGTTLNGEIRRAVIEFDLTGALPAGARILSAKLTLMMTKTISGPQNVSLHRLLSEWGEGTSHAPLEEGGGAPSTTNDATWLHTFHPSQLWLTPGGDFVSTPSATRSVGSTIPHTWVGAGLMADLQTWLSDPTTNHGWLVVGAEAVNASAKRFGSSEGPQILRPKLTITYEP
jgi:hypothetical protein